MQRHQSGQSAVAQQHEDTGRTRRQVEQQRAQQRQQQSDRAMQHEPRCRRGSVRPACGPGHSGCRGNRDDESEPGDHRAASQRRRPGRRRSAPDCRRDTGAPIACSSDRAAIAAAMSRRPNQLVVIATKAVSMTRCVSAAPARDTSAHATTNCRLAEPALIQAPMRQDATDASSSCRNERQRHHERQGSRRSPAQPMVGKRPVPGPAARRPPMPPAATRRDGRPRPGRRRSATTADRAPAPARASATTISNKPSNATDTPTAAIPSVPAFAKPATAATSNAIAPAQDTNSAAAQRQQRRRCSCARSPPAARRR